MLNKQVKIKKLNIVGKIVDFNFIYGKVIVQVRFPSGSTWEGDRENLIIYE